MKALTIGTIAAALLTATTAYADVTIGGSAEIVLGTSTEQSKEKVSSEAQVDIGLTNLLDNGAIIDLDFAVK